MCRRFSGLFWPIFASFNGVNIQNLILTPLKEAKIGSKEPENRLTSGFSTASDGTFRTVYTVRYAEIVVILHAFQKKSKKGIETPKQDIDLIHSRLKLVEAMYKEWKEKRGKK